eukprot:CAMPEP_0177764678 /NCGR_PEP_ID=MMETSP0491_2-20121128/7538_1 /TAXON_ID=63592 /ORGANISM="Tetraselmis chuii, Strain PLY429" /LENGTH=327 /DNA_ID=CAMNT_0019280879 /DNA_START=291 /DNA_END=1274 /DNA_ORIENTATION=-
MSHFLLRSTSRLHLAPLSDSGRRVHGRQPQRRRVHCRLGVVITGGTKGVGFSLAREFLRGGDKVLICGRSQERLKDAHEALRTEFGTDAQVFSVACDVSSPKQVARLEAEAASKLGTVHQWINNAGMASRTRVSLMDMEPAEIVEVAGTNVIGSMLCCRAAVRLMKAQPQAASPIYHIYNCGFSSWGASFSSSTAPHKATKRALAQLTATLSEELKAAGISSIGVHQLSPGMVLTDLLLEESSAGARKFFNVMAEEPETVAAALVPKMKAMQERCGSVEFLTPADALRRVATGFPSIIQGGRFFDKEGNRVVQPGQRYKPNGVRSQY